jgi:hypothetical protein
MNAQIKQCGPVVVLMLVAAAVVVHADEATPTPTPAAKSEQELSDVAGQIKLNKDAVGKEGPIVISNENLSDLAGKGTVTEVTKTGAQNQNRSLADVRGDGAGIEGQLDGFSEGLDKKQRWQALYGQQIEMLKDINKQIEVLDYEIPGLWRDFYSWDDPAYRDGVIKPKLDKALAQRQKLEVDLQKGKAKLDEIEIQARRDGGEPGWFRGFEKLPTPKPTVGVMPP